MMDIKKKSKILLLGASGDLGFDLLKELSKYEVTVGAHYYRSKGKLVQFAKDLHRSEIYLIQGALNSQADAKAIIKKFIRQAGGIDYLVQLSGGNTKVVPWSKLTQKVWDNDLAFNLTGPFFIAQEAMAKMKKGGKVILVSTASASHGGGGNTLAYGVAKAGIECLIKRLAKDAAKENILVNAVAPGHIMTGKKAKLPTKKLKKRVSFIPLKRAGKTSDVTNMFLYLLSSAGDFITGEVFTIDGGDFL